MQPLEFWGECYEMLNKKYQLYAQHKLNFMQFFALMQMDTEHYRWLAIYFANPAFEHAGIGLWAFLKCPGVYCEMKLTASPSTDLIERPLLPKQNQAALQFEFCARALSEYWEQRLESDGMELHGTQLREPFPKISHAKKPRRTYPFRIKRAHI